MLIPFLNSNTTLQSAILCLFCLSFSLISLFALRKIWPLERRPQLSEIHGHIFGVIGIIYAVLIGAITIGSWEKFNHADDLIIKEASSAINIYNAAPGLGSGADKEVQAFVKNYLEGIIQNEWPQIQKGHSPEIKEVNVTALTKRIAQIEPKNKSQELFIPIVTHEVNSLRKIREERLFLAETSLNSAILKLVFIGAFLTLMACVFLDDKKSRLDNVILLSILSILIGLVLSAVVGLDHPYQGDLSISHRPLESALNYINSGGN